MTRSGHKKINHLILKIYVLIPLLVDDPLWVADEKTTLLYYKVLIPLLVDDPLWESWIATANRGCRVLIPLLVDDPLWVYHLQSSKLRKYCLNPSFSG